MRLPRRILLVFGVFAILVAAGSPLLSEKQTDQVQRDLIRVISEVFQRAASHAATGEVVRPEFATPNIELSVAEFGDGWTPTCEIQIEAVASDPRRNLHALVIVPRDRISSSGASFRAFAFFVGRPVVSADLLRNPPAWLERSEGGYASLEPDLDWVRGRSELSVESTECQDFSFSIIVGTPK